MSVPSVPRWFGRRDLFAIGGRAVPSYPLLLYLGCVSGILAGALAAGAAGLPERRFAVVTCLLLVPALAGARLWYLLGHPRRFLREPRSLWRRTEGGMALYGGWVAGVAASVPVLHRAGLPFWGYWDAASVTLLVGSIVTRFGCLIHGCCAGRATDGPLGWWMPDHSGSWKRRYPTPLLESAWAALLLVGLFTAGARLTVPGLRFASVVGAYAGGRWFLERTRESALPLRLLSFNSCFSAALVLAAATVLFLRLHP